MPDLQVILQRNTAGAAPIILDSAGREMPGLETDKRLRLIAGGLRKVRGCYFTTALITDAEVDRRIRETHDKEYLDFLQRLSRECRPGELHFDTEHVAPGVRADTPVLANVYQLAYEGARTTIAAARVATENGMAYALCRPPGHHAGSFWLGGYCYLNNAVMAALELRAAGFPLVGIVDFDFHFGNGSSALVTHRPDLFFGSLHHATEAAYPYQKVAVPNERQRFVSFAHSPTTEEYIEQLESVVKAAIDFGSSALVVSVGYDIVAGDPHGGWRLSPESLRDIGNVLAAPGLPLCLVQEGGYQLSRLEQCSANLASGLLCGRKGSVLHAYA